MVRLFTPALIAATLSGCSEYDSLSVDSDGLFSDTGVPPATEPEPPPGPEIENDFLALPPASTPEYVFVANASRNTVTRIRAADQHVLTTEVGRGPEIIRTTPDGLTAITFNQGDDTVSVIDVATMQAVTLEVRDNFNQLELTPDGRFALLWHDTHAEQEDDTPVDGVQSYNEISVVDLMTLAHTPMAVGFNPRDVAFTDDSSLAAVVSDDALALVDFTTVPLQVPTLIALSDGLLDPPVAEEVMLEPAGRYAFVRRFGDDALLSIDLGDNTVTSIAVGEGLTDLDITPDGSTVVVVSRDARELWLLSATTPTGPPVVLPFPMDLPLGALTLSRDGQTGILYTTASPVDRYIHWDRAANTLTPRALVKPVSALSISPTSEDMLVIHTREDAPDAELGPFYGEWALTMVDLQLQLPTPMRLPSEPTGFANGPGGRFVYFIMENEPYLEVLDYETRLYEETALRSEPVWVGVLPDADPTDGDEPYAWASQVHELGRISFYDPDDGSFETLTGFELNAAIED